MRYKQPLNCFSYAIFLILFLTPSLVCSASENEVDKRLQKLEQQMQLMEQNYKQQIKTLQIEVERLKSAADKSETATKVDDVNELSEIEKLKQQALSMIGDAKSAKVEKAEDSDTEFTAGNLGLQAENPEISVTGDVVYTLQSIDKQRTNADSKFRSLGLHYESYLDPYSKFKAAVPVLENDSLLGEAYITRYGVRHNLNFTLGKFRQQFGVVNRWHKHGLDYVDFPLALRRIFGNGGLNQKGISLDWQLGRSGRETQELTLQLTDAENAGLFGGNGRGMPSLLAHFKTFKDIDASRYREIGLTAMAGTNDQWSVLSPGGITSLDKTRPVYAFGLDYTYLWEPVDNMRYRNFIWRTELYGMKKEILTPDTGSRDSITSWGGYTNFQWRVDRDLDTGLRLDYYQPDNKDYASLAGLSLAPLAVAADDPEEWQICPYVTWHQSPWVRYRLEFNYKSGHNMGPDERKLMLQCIWAAGPHKHDRY
jgi:hypothetical protein